MEDRTTATLFGNRLQQERLGIGVGGVDRHPDRHRLLRALLGPPLHHRGVDGVAHHQLLSLGGEGRRLRFEGGGLRLRQQTPDAFEDRVGLGPDGAF